jgi:3-phosphoshikimate 1-carboxyvinyltransferase
LRALTSHPAAPLSGAVRPPGDKSISHRAVIIGALAVGETVVRGLLEGEDVRRTIQAMRAMGVAAERVDGDENGNEWRIHGVGIGGLAPPEDVLDLGNSGTGARLLLGVLAGHPITATLTGDASLRARPMDRIAEPLVMAGARIDARRGCRLPLTVIGAAEPMPIDYRLPMASAQVKSAVLLAGLSAPGETSVVEPAPTRDHTERMLVHFGADLRVEEEPDGARRITLVGQPELAPAEIDVPADISSAAFPLVAALVVPGSEIDLPGVGMNPGRIGLIQTLRDMGAEIETSGEREAAGEPIADLRVRASALQGIEVPAERAPLMIDEYPILGVAAASARGRTVMRGLGELRVKESDRLAALAEGLAACGVGVEVEGDDLIVEGAGGPPPGGVAVATTIATRHDHRLQMSFLVMGAAAQQPVAIDHGGAIATSFPGFVDLMNNLGAKIDMEAA